MSQEKGGPAFPSKIENHSDKEVTGFNGEPIKAKTFSSYPGMSLRDYFAAKAMQSIEISNGGGTDEWIAAAAYERADAMLLERAK